MSLLSSLEARVELMTQMQSTRRQLQRHVHALTAGGSVKFAPGPKTEADSRGEMNPRRSKSALRTKSPRTSSSCSLPVKEGQDRRSQSALRGSKHPGSLAMPFAAGPMGGSVHVALTHRIPTDGCGAGSRNGSPRRSPRQSMRPQAPTTTRRTADLDVDLAPDRVYATTIPSTKDRLSPLRAAMRPGAAEDPSSSERPMETALWSHLQDQVACISKLQQEVEGLRSQMQTLSSQAPASSSTPRPRQSRGGEAGGDVAVASHSKSLKSSAELQPASSFGSSGDHVFARAGSTSASPSHERVASPVYGHEGSPTSRVSNLQRQLAHERRQREEAAREWMLERQSLMAELEQMRTKGLREGDVPTDGRLSEAVSNHGNSAETLSPLDLMARACSTDEAGPIEVRKEVISTFVWPFCLEGCGSNVELSEDGYTATRTRGCRQSVVIGGTPLERKVPGWYFEVVVKEVVSGWVGGLGIGVTRTPPSLLSRLPDKAWRMAETFIIGYWGCVFLDGREKRTRWRADDLQVGTRVGLLTTGETTRRDLLVFVDGKLVVRADGALPPGTDTLYPIVDVFAATQAVELQARAVLPQPPWGPDPTPPGSPTSSVSTVNTLPPRTDAPRQSDASER